MSVKQHLVTAEAFSEMPDPPDKRLELVSGQIVEKPLLGALGGLAKGICSRRLASLWSTTILASFSPASAVCCIASRTRCVLLKSRSSNRSVSR